MKKIDELYNKGNDCDCCKNQYWLTKDSLACKRQDSKLPCQYEEDNCTGDCNQCSKLFDCEMSDADVVRG
ncbi:hypothetical protein M2146_001075 [Lachnospiraceae bacterium PF1-22]